MTNDPGAGSRTGLESADRAAIRIALRQTAPDLLAYFERRLASQEDAADALAETMLQAWRRVDRLPEDPTQARMWLFTIAHHVLANQHRANRRRAALTDRLRSHLADTPITQPDPAEGQAIRDAIQRLPTDQRELVTLVHWDGFSLVEAAHILDLNPSTARSRYATARRTLREALIAEDATA